MLVAGTSHARHGNFSFERIAARWSACSNCDTVDRDCFW